MLVEAQVTINGSRTAIWSAITNIDSAAEMLTGVEKIEVVGRPASGLVGLRWRETRKFFGQTATVEKVITEAVENEFYKTSAESDGSVYLSTMVIAEGSDGMTLATSHLTVAQGRVGSISLLLMGIVFKSVARKALLLDLNDFKAAVERQ